jgi:hypothetical protein
MYCESGKRFAGISMTVTPPEKRLNKTEWDTVGTIVGFDYRVRSVRDSYFLPPHDLNKMEMKECVEPENKETRQRQARDLTLKANKMHTRAVICGVCFLLVFMLADGRLQSQSNGRGLQVDDNDDNVNVIVGYKNRAAMPNIEGRKPLNNVRQFERTNAVAMQIPVSELDSLQNDPDVAYVEEDSMVHLFAETIPWGIPAIQADTTIIPRPNTNSDCFKICIVDSGLLVRHSDIVSPFVFVRSLRLSIPPLLFLLLTLTILYS